MRVHLSSVVALTAALTVSLAAGAAHAGADLSVNVSQPANVYVYAPVRYTVRVSNIGNQTSAATTLTIQLPRTHTSPTVTVLGTVGAMTAGCTRSGTAITCPVARIGRGSSLPFFVDLTIPQSSEPVTLQANVSRSGNESTANNSYTHTAALLNIDHVIAGGSTAVNRHCTGTGLTSFFECELYPSSLMEHESQLNLDGSITFLNIGSSTYGGTWTQPAPNRLRMTYTDGTNTVATFDGYGVDGCFEGRTTFPNSTYVSMYQVCLR